MFFDSADDYLYPVNNPLQDPMGNNAYCPIEIDTEYTHPSYDINNPSEDICTNITVQCRSIIHPEGIIYAHPDIAPLARHWVFKNPFAVLDYLEHFGHDVELHRLSSWDTVTPMPWIQFDLYSFFAVAELERVFTGQYRDDVRYLCVNPSKQGIDQSRRLRTYNQLSTHYQNWVEMPWILTLNQQVYRVRIAWYDTSAMHGNSSYKNFCTNAGVELKHKDNFSSDEKGKMLIMYNEREDDFDTYALGDLHNYDALIGNAEKFKLIYQSLGLSGYYTAPRLTIGSTVARLFESCIKNLFKADVTNRYAINTFCKYGSADWIKQRKNTTGCLNAKVDGGRCRNNRPIDTVATGVICDIDISGCYGEGLRVQTYPLGIPVIIDYPISSTNNSYETLRQFLKRYKKELVPGLWQARVSTFDSYRLKYPQDRLISWLPPKDISKMPTDSELSDTDEWWAVDNVGEIKIFTNEVKHALITHDDIQWIEYIASARQRNELLDELYVETAMFYPASDRVDSVDSLISEHEKHSGKNLTFSGKAKGRTRKVAIEEECHKWYGVNLGELLVTNLLVERKKYPKKSPLNELYKLCINTVYGDMVSPFFTVGNVVVGNNITARARALAWCMEKGFHGWQSITDGCAFDLNRVVYPRDGYSVSGEYVVGIYNKHHMKQHILASLGTELSVTLKSDSHQLVVKDLETDTKQLNDAEYSQWLDANVDLVIQQSDSCKTLSYNQALQWIDSTAMKHLQQLFPGLDILHQPTKDIKGNERIGQFSFESKGLFDLATFHGTANYTLGLKQRQKFAMRSYSKKAHKTIVLADDLQIKSLDIKPSEVFLMSLLQPKKIERSNVYLKERILKIGDYRRNYQKWKNSQAYPGCSVETPALLREFSLSQFTFQTIAQYHSWKKEYQRLLRNYGQSYEMFFLNDDGSLNYQGMIETVDAAINDGKTSFFDGMDKREKHIYRQYMKHAEIDCLNRLQEQLGKRYKVGFYILDDGSTNELD